MKVVRNALQVRSICIPVAIALAVIVFPARGSAQTFLDSSRVSSTVLDLSQGPAIDTADFWLRSVNDSLYFVFGYLGSPDSASSITGYGVLVQGTTVQGKWEVPFYVPGSTPPGDYPLYVVAYDHTFSQSTFNTGKTVHITGGDTAPPPLAGQATISPTSMDVSGGIQYDTVTVPLQDDLSGVGYVNARFLNAAEHEVAGSFAVRISGDSLNGIWQSVTEIPQNANSPLHLVIDATDKALNTANLNTGVILTVSGSDTIPPYFSGPATITPPSVNPSTGDKNVTVTATVGDTYTKVFFVTLSLTDSAGNAVDVQDASLYSGDSTNGQWRAILTIPQLAPAGAESLRIYAQDRAGNYLSINTQQIVTVYRDPESMVTFQVDMRRLYRLGFIGHLNATPLLEIFDGINKGIFYLNGNSADSVWSVQTPIVVGQTIHYAFAMDASGRTYELGGASGARTLTISSTAPIVLSAVPFDNIPAEAIDPSYAAIVATGFSPDNLTTFSFRADPNQTYVTATLTTLNQACLVSLRRYAGAADGTPPPGIATMSSGVFWAFGLIPSGTHFKAGLTFEYNLFGGITDPAALRMLRRAAPGQAWAIIPTTLNIDQQTLSVNVTDTLGEWTFGSTSGSNTLVPQLPGIASNPNPTDGQLQVNNDQEFSWSPVAAARTYDFYLWKSTDPEPGTPMAANLTTSRYRPYPPEAYGTSYQWKVVSRNVLGVTSGPVWSYTTENVSDLIVSAVEMPASAYSGQLVDVKWTVKNIGASGTTPPNWNDYIYLSLDSEYNTRRVTQLGRFENVNFLNPGESYVNHASVTLPNGVFGPYHIMVYTDQFHSVAETSYTNNMFVQSFTIILTPPPDLQVTAMQVPDNVFSGQSITLNYTVKNQGNNSTGTARWYDAVYISHDTVLDNSVDTLLRTFVHIGALQPDSEYQGSVTVTLPDAISGLYNLFVYTDYRNDVYEYTLENNNTRRAQTTVTLSPPPDLVVSSVTAPSTGNSGTKIGVDWTVTNQGLGVTSRGWQDRIALCKSSTFNPDSAFIIGTFSSPRILDVDSSYHQHRDLTLPNGISGPWYIFVEADWRNSVFESIFENNNTNHTAGTVEISLSPWPDLQVTAIQKPDNATANDIISIGWTVRNAGAGALAGGSWLDSVFLSSSAVWDSSAAIPFGGLPMTGDLNTDSTYSQVLRARLPIRLTTGTYYLYVATDALHSVFEYTDTLNNRMRSGPIQISGYPPVDLAVTAISGPDTGSSGQPVTLHYTVQNIGSGTTPVRGWVDVIDLLSDTINGVSHEYPLARIQRSEPLAPGTSYTRDFVATLPNGISGSYHVSVLCDSADDAGDVDRSNNTGVLSPPLAVTLSPSPDLRVTAATIPAVAQSGQPYTVRWSVQNNSASAVPGVKWYDAVYVSTSQIVDYSAIRLGTVERTGPLAVGDSYTDSLEVQIPLSVSGTQYIIVQADSRNDIYEYGAESNNSQSALVTIQLPPPSDLVVTDVQVPANAVAGEDVMITWTIRNQGLNPATGRMSEAAYFSSDAAWSLDDPLLGIVTREINLAPGASTTVQMKANLSKTVLADSSGDITGPTPGLMLGDYFAIVRTNIKNNIRETDLTNNGRTSTGTSNVDVHLLSLSVPVSDSIDFGQQKFYRVVVPAGVDLRLRATGSVPPSVDMYVAYNRVPTPSNYDFVTLDPLLAREILVPSTVEGSYYILLRSQRNRLLERYSLLAQGLSFTVSSVQPYVGGSGGTVTTTLSGAGFRDSTRVFLARGGIPVTEGQIRHLDNTMQLVVRWNLQNVPIGSYDILANNPGGIDALLPDGFRVEPARELTVGFGKNIPGKLLVARRETFSFEFSNTSNIDIPYFFAFIAVPPNTEVQLTTSDGLKRRSQIVPDSLVQGGTPLDDYIDLPTARYIPVLARDVPPGEALNCRVLVRNASLFSGADMPMFVGMRSMDRIAFLNLQLTNIEGLRTRIVSDPSGISSEILSKAYDSKEFASYVFDQYRNLGLIDRDDTLRGVTNMSAHPGLEATFPPMKIMQVSDPARKQLTIQGNAECEEFFNKLGCAASIGDCFIPIPIPPVINYVSCAIGVSGCFGVDTGLLGCFGILSAITCLAKEIICNHIVASLDPNDMLGPDGYGDRRWVSLNKNLAYRIRFQNDPGRATAPAQRVAVTQQLDSTVDIRTFRLGSFSFANQTFDIPGNPAFYSTRLDLRDSLGIYVDVTAGIDVLSGKAFWNFKSIDPSTGELPIDPLVGLLPVDDSTSRGNGYVSYTIRPKQESRSGDSIRSVARIVFDQNDPMDTRIIFNTIDAHYPQSTVRPLPATTGLTSFPVRWSGVDDSSGSHLESFSIYVSRDDSPYVAWLTDVTDTMGVFNGAANSRYSFFSIAGDFAGNTEPTKSVPDASVQIVTDVRDGHSPLPATYALEQNYPNPFNPVTRLGYQLPVESRVTLKIFNVIGQLVATLVDDVEEPGYKGVEWNAGNAASGVYFYHLEATSVAAPRQTFIQVKKSLLIK